MQPPVVQELSARETPANSSLDTPLFERTSAARKTWLPGAFAGVATVAAIYFMEPSRNQVVGDSMKPGLENGQSVWSMKHLPLSRFDIVVFSDPKVADTTDVKRVIGLPGETIEFGRYELLVNGVSIKQPDSVGWTAPHEKVVVPPGCVYVLGDNRNNSVDSRELGAIPISACSKAISR